MNTMKEAERAADAHARVARVALDAFVQLALSGVDFAAAVSAMKLVEREMKDANVPQKDAEAYSQSIHILQAAQTFVFATRSTPLGREIEQHARERETEARRIVETVRRALEGPCGREDCEECGTRGVAHKGQVALMPMGPGKYDDLCSYVLERASAQVAIVLVVDGKRGSGFSVQSLRPDATAKLPAALRLMADEIEASLGVFVNAAHQRAADGSLYYRVIDDDIAIAVYPQTFGRARLCLVLNESLEDQFDYDDPARALEAAAVWTGRGDPLDGWVRARDGRRREGGDPAKEEVRA